MVRRVNIGRPRLAYQQASMKRKRAAAALAIPTTNLLFQFEAWQQTDADGAAVVNLQDQSSTGGNLTQATGANRATMRTAGGPNSLKNVEFNGSTSFYTAVSNFMAGRGSGLIAYVLKCAADPAASDPASGLDRWQTDGGGQDTHYPYTDSNVYEGWGTNARKTSANPALSLAAWHCLMIRSAAADWKLWLNNFQWFTTATNTVDFTGNHTFGRAESASRFFNGRLAALYVYGPDPGETARASLWAFIASKYALTAWNGT